MLQSNILSLGTGYYRGRKWTQPAVDSQLYKLYELHYLSLCMSVMIDCKACVVNMYRAGIA
jgi:hypothetical protein